MENINRTIYGNYIQACLFTDSAISYKEYTTLNQKHGILKDTLPASDSKPSLKYIAWGNKGHTLKVGADGIPYPDTVPHSATDAALYGQLPFVAREATNDLSLTERAKYAHRVVKNIGGINYILYYLRRLDKTNMVPSMYYTQVSNNQEIKVGFVPTSANLNPTPPVIGNDGTNLISADYVSVESIMTIRFDEKEIAEMINVAKVFFGKEQLAIISEMGLCTGVDRMVTIPGTGGSGNSNFLEAIVAQVAAHAAVNYSLVHIRRDLAIEIDVGSIEPLFAVTPTDGANTLTAGTGPGTLGSNSNGL